jgi:arsenate reductase
MAEGLLRTLYGNCYEAFSAGVQPTEIHPYAVEVMKELDIDISTHRSKNIEEFRGMMFDSVVTVCDNAKESCPFFPGKTVLHQGFEDPVVFQGNHEETLEIFRRVRNEIKSWIIEKFGITS